jgi:nitrogen PTS system EIIA component
MDNQLDLVHVLVPQRVLVLDSTTKIEALRTLADSLAATSQVQDRDALIEGILHREELMSTGIGMGIAVPHVRLASVTEPVMSAGICHTPLADYESLDGVPVRLIFMIAAGQNQHAEYLRLLSSLSLTLKDEKLRDALIAAPDTLAFYNTLLGRED